MRTKQKMLVGSLVAGITSLGLTAFAFAADQLAGMTASSTPLDFATAAITDVKSYAYPVFGVLFALGIVVSLIWLGYRKIRGVAKGKH